MTETTPTPDDYNRLAALFKAGQYEELKNQANLLLKHHPNYGFAWKMLAAALNAQGLDSLQALRKAAELLPGDAWLHCHLGSVLHARGGIGEAEISYRKALQADPDYAEVHFRLGAILQAKNQLKEAVDSYRRVLQIKPDAAEAHNNLGNVFRELGRFDEAAASYQRVLEIKPTAETYINLGHILEMLCRHDEALTNYKLSLQFKNNWKEKLPGLTTPLVLFTGTHDAQERKS